MSLAIQVRSIPDDRVIPTLVYDQLGAYGLVNEVLEVAQPHKTLFTDLAVGTEAMIRFQHPGVIDAAGIQLEDPGSPPRGFVYTIRASELDAVILAKVGIATICRRLMDEPALGSTEVLHVLAVVAAAAEDLEIPGMVELAVFEV